MKQLLLLAVFSAVAVAAKDYDAMFREFKSTHLKAYANEAEEATRFKNFVRNMKKAEVMQAANPLAVFGANHFADMSEAEFAKKIHGAKYFANAKAKSTKKVAAPLAERMSAAGEKVDWREKGAVTPVKNQGSCGSCWAYSATGSIEGAWAVAGNPLTAVSEQELVACDTTDGGCDGGLMDDAFEWLINNRKGEIVTEASYPYASASGYSPACKSTSELNTLPVGAVITGYNHLEESEDTLAAAVLKNPVSVAVDATSFQSYRNGILTSCINRQINHGVLAVGYDDTNVPPYWIIKNSWGTSWGEGGYLRLAKGSNQCLITEYATYAIVKTNATKL